MEYRLNKKRLLDILAGWNRHLKRRVHLVACGGTAMTLLGVKPSTKDVDFMVPRTQERNYLTKTTLSVGVQTNHSSRMGTCGGAFSLRSLSREPNPYDRTFEISP
jgi:hypothetical protein